MNVERTFASALTESSFPKKHCLDDRPDSIMGAEQISNGATVQDDGADKDTAIVKLESDKSQYDEVAVAPIRSKKQTMSDLFTIVSCSGVSMEMRSQTLNRKTDG